MKHKSPRLQIIKDQQTLDEYVTLINKCLGDSFLLPSEKIVLQGIKRQIQGNSDYYYSDYFKWFSGRQQRYIKKISHLLRERRAGTEPTEFQKNFSKEQKRLFKLATYCYRRYPTRRRLYEHILSKTYNDENYIPTEKEYNLLVNNKYFQRALKNHNNPYDNGMFDICDIATTKREFYDYSYHGGRFGSRSYKLPKGAKVLVTKINCDVSSICINKSDIQVTILPLGKGPTASEQVVSIRNLKKYKAPRQK